MPGGSASGVVLVFPSPAPIRIARFCSGAFLPTDPPRDGDADDAVCPLRVPSSIRREGRETGHERAGRTLERKHGPKRKPARDTKRNQTTRPPPSEGAGSKRRNMPSSGSGRIATILPVKRPGEKTGPRAGRRRRNKGSMMITPRRSCVNNNNLFRRCADPAPASSISRPIDLSTARLRRRDFVSIIQRVPPPRRRRQR